MPGFVEHLQITEDRQPATHDSPQMADYFDAEARLAFCDQWGFAQYSIEKDFREDGIPYLSLEREYVLSGVGQLRTRVQAFLETLGN